MAESKGFKLSHGLPPHAVIGILGGGQLGRMTALAAARLGYRTHIYCQDKNEPAAAVTNLLTLAPFDDQKALADFAAAVDVITLEWENIPTDTLTFLARVKPVCPGADVLAVTQDRAAEKKFANDLGISTAPYTVVTSLTELEMAAKQIGVPAILKTARMGYDGKGQVKIEKTTDLAAAWKHLQTDYAVLEGFVDFECEISVIVARNSVGHIITYPAVHNIHKNHILYQTHAPASIAKPLLAEADRIARTMAEKFALQGLLAIEMFVLKQPNAAGHMIVVNEMAPRPHNSGHWTMDACPVSQFEMLVRAIAGLPLHGAKPHSRAMMQNLLGDEILNATKMMQEGGLVHLYGKSEAREGRKMGHVNFLKGTYDE
jgi:5-(carboxyamino)imidazole ribonucleotide synthase